MAKWRSGSYHHLVLQLPLEIKPGCHCVEKHAKTNIEKRKLSGDEGMIMQSYYQEEAGPAHPPTDQWAPPPPLHPSLTARIRKWYFSSLLKSSNIEGSASNGDLGGLCLFGIFRANFQDVTRGLVSLREMEEICGIRHTQVPHLARSCYERKDGIVHTSNSLDTV